jgi:carbon-monoxide dehydrogenase catalytic subunit
MVVDVQCVFQNLANVAKCFHTKLITTHPIAKMEQDNVIHIEFDEHHAMEDAKKIVTMAIDNFENRSADIMIPKHKAVQIAGFGVESIEYHLGGTFRGSYYTLNDNIINGRIRGVAGVVGCNNARVKHNEEHVTIIKELIKNDVLVLTTGCSGITLAMHGLLTLWEFPRCSTWVLVWTTRAFFWQPPRWLRRADSATTFAMPRWRAVRPNG